MAQQTINVGAAPNDGTGTPLRTAFQYTNSNFSELYTAVGPSGNNIVVPGTATITGDLTVDTSTLKVDSANNRVGVLTTSPLYALDVNGDAKVTNALRYFVGSTQYGLSFANAGALGVESYQGTYIFLGTGSGASATERLRIANDGVCTWSNVGGGSGTAMTLNSTGLGVGVAPTEPLTVRASVAAIGMFHSTNANGPYVIFHNSTAKFGDIGSELAITGGGSADNLTLNSRSTSNLCFAVADSVKMRLDVSGNLSLANGNLVMGTSGKGIDFSATSEGSGTMTSELLNDYEEGTWTGTLLGGNTNPTTPITATGRYTKVGRLVTVQINFDNVNTTGASGKVFINGIPFTNSSVASYGTAASFVAATFTGTLVCVIDPNETSAIVFLDVRSGSNWANADHNAGTGRYVRATITYTVA